MLQRTLLSMVDILIFELTSQERFDVDGEDHAYKEPIPLDDSLFWELLLM